LGLAALEMIDGLLILVATVLIAVGLLIWRRR
jgi:hypothetical protein